MTVHTSKISRLLKKVPTVVWAGAWSVVLLTLGAVVTILAQQLLDESSSNLVVVEVIEASTLAVNEPDVLSGLYTIERFQYLPDAIPGDREILAGLLEIRGDAVGWDIVLFDPQKGLDLAQGDTDVVRCGGQINFATTPPTLLMMSADSEMYEMLGLRMLGRSIKMPQLASAEAHDNLCGRASANKRRASFNLGNARVVTPGLHESDHSSEKFVLTLQNGQFILMWQSMPMVSPFLP